jgi:hypothetical protein
MMLEDHDLWYSMEMVETTNHVLLVEHKKKMAKTKWITIPHIIRNTMRKEIFDAIITLY